ncbi:WD40/YVTN/BNR-like repeat-containing protein [Halomarina salina]|nr:hypothetical protein [Halomarina salina]
MKVTAATAVGVAAGATQSVTAAVNGWSEVSSPTGKTVYDVVMTTEGPFAVAGGGDVLARRADGWELVLEKGPAVQSNPLRGIDVTDDGSVVWFCGGSGVVGRYDVVAEELTDYSAPKGKTSSWLTCSVTEQAGGEKVYFLNGSGEFLSGEYDDGGMTWGEVVKPGGGSSAPGLDFHEDQEGFACDTNGKVYETLDGGEDWSTVGIDEASVALYDISAASADTVAVAGGGGYIFRRDDSGGFTGVRVGEKTVRAVDRTSGAGLAGGGGGYVYELTDTGWEQFETPVSTTFHGVALDTSGSFPDVAVGGSGTIVERGEYTRTPPNTVRIETSADATTGYGFTVDGAVEKASSADSGDTVDGDTVTGSVGGSDTVDAYDYSGEITDFAVTSGDAEDITVYVNGTATAIEDLDDDPWTEVSSPTSKGLNAVVESADGAFAVGNGGDALVRRDSGWEQVLDFGPGGESNPLRGASASDDGQNVWFAGGSGVLGKYDVVAERLTDYSAPQGKTSTWEDVAAAGPAGGESIVVANGSGEVLPGTVDDGAISWGDVVKPGGGASIKGATAFDEDTFFVCDTNAKVYRSDDAGTTWTAIGIDGGSVGLYGVAAASGDDVNAAGGDGSVFAYNGAVWTKLDAGGNGLLAITRSGEDGLAVGSSGAVFERTADGWEPDDDVPVSNTLKGVVIGSSGPDVAVGGSGTILERRG